MTTTYNKLNFLQLIKEKIEKEQRRKKAQLAFN